MRLMALGFLGVSVTALVVGCGSAEPGSSTITGTIDQATFPAKVSSIAIISDSAAPASAPVAEDGSFSLSLLEGASYRFTLGADGTVPLILRQEGDRLQTMISITGGGASADIGSVRFWGGAASASSDSTSVVPVPSTDPTAAETCVDGLIPRTGQPCSTGEVAVTCEDMGDHHGGMGPRRGGHHGGPPPADEVIAFDATTDASAEQAVAIPERTLATGVGCGGCPGM